MQHVHLFCGFYSLNQSSQWRLAMAPTMKIDFLLSRNIVLIPGLLLAAEVAFDLFAID
jgi:hypothetical protein